MTNEGAGAAGTQGLVRETAQLVKSAMSFSWAVTVFGVNQMANVMSPETLSRGTRRTAEAVDRLARATGEPLEGVLKTTFAVGSNVQSGIVDLAFGLVTPSPVPDRARPSRGERGMTIPMRAGVTRRMAGVRTVSSGAVHRPIRQDELVATLTRYQAEGAASYGDVAQAVNSLWKCEGFSTTLGKHFMPGNTLQDLRLPAGALPIAHVGWGSGSTERLVFDVDRLTERFDTFSAPGYRAFAYEGIGAILRIYEPGLFKVMSGAMGLIPLDAPDGPAMDGFYADYLSAFPAPLQRTITHGYGRLMAFSNMDIYSVIQSAASLPEERVEPAVHGAAFAFAFMNSEDMPRLLEKSNIPFAAPVRAAFQNGLIYSLVFFDWFAPGLLASWRPQAPLEERLVEHARREAALASARGYPLAFRLENPLV